MTWIVGRTFVSGYAAIISDVQVTWGSQSADCLRKVYAVAPNMACGFSGSVETGFKLLADMRRFAAIHGADEKLISPRRFLQEWHRSGRREFQKSPVKDQKLGCSLLLAGFSPRESVGKNVYSPRTDIIVMRHSNGFQPKVMCRNQATSIGSGSTKEKYAMFLDDLNEPKNSVTTDSDHGSLGKAGETLAFLTSIMMRQNIEAGISPHVHCTLVGSFGVRSEAIDFTCSKGDEKIEHKMPPVAATHSDFKEFERKFIGLGSALALA
ncbi:hypothetical protein [Marinobacter sp.]|uniref:hypothetical protein n=1 Tax=Marinobacter sp. TaxID=50741 RepID=UPI003A91FAAE